MQKIFLFAFSFSAFCLHAQTSKKPAIPVKKPMAAKPVATGSLKTFQDSASYALGLNIAQSLKKDLSGLNTNIMMDAMKSVFNNQPAKLDEAMVRSLLMDLSKKEQEKQSQKVIDEGQAFLNKNKTNPNIKTTASGLQYEVIKQGTGDKPSAGDTVVCNYRGFLIDGTEFDNSYDRGEPLSIPLDVVVKGWTEGMQLMPVGSKYKLYIPQELGYGLNRAGQIPPGSALIFEIELLDVKKAR